MASKTLAAIVVFSVILLIFIIVTNFNMHTASVLKLANQNHISTEQTQSSSANKMIQITWYKRPKWLPSSFNFTQCQIKNCVLSDSRNTSFQYQAVIFHYRFLSKTVPKKAKGQIWIIWIAESPANDKPLPEKWRHVFDWSATYRTESEIHIQRIITLRVKPLFKNYSDIFRKKTKLVAWVVSNCKTPSKRHVFVKEMKKYIDIDVFGKCGKNKLLCKNETILSCHSLISKDFKFYLGFENSICTDYLTEKVAYNFLDNNNMIYVVRGAPNVKQFVPKNTIINTQDFKSPKELASFLLKVGSNETLYISYLKQKNKFRVLTNKNERALCKICELLNTYEDRVIPWSGRNFNHWYRYGACKRPTDL